MRVCSAVLCLGLGLGLFTSAPSYADELRWLSIALRGGVTGPAVLGGEAAETFQQYDIAATVGLPWSWYSESGWGVGTRVITSVGALTAAGDTAFLTTLVPDFAFGLRDSLLALDIGGGIALLSRYEFGRQDMGGPFQFVFTFGLTVPVYKALGAGYRFHHMSDARIYHSARGVDVHMLEVVYRFR
jgi:Lipid A 3-O-deacylase (PagL)